MRAWHWILGLALLLGTVACGPESKEDNPSCCFYACEGPREQYFSMYFGSEQECRSLAESRCELEDQPGVARLEFKDNVPFDEMVGLNATCQMDFEATFTSSTS